MKSFVGNIIFKQARAHLFAHRWFQEYLFTISNSIYQVLKGIKTEVVFTKIEMNNEWNFNFLQNSPL